MLIIYHNALLSTAHFIPDVGLLFVRSQEGKTSGINTQWMYLSQVPCDLCAMFLAFQNISMMHFLLPFAPT